MEDGNLLVCDHSSTYVLVYSSDGKYLDSCNVGRYPWNIAILEDASQAVVSLTGNLKLASVIAVCGHFSYRYHVCLGIEPYSKCLLLFHFQ
jgi:DNA-binding beta-propeller fold protein YncE